MKYKFKIGDIVYHDIVNNPNVHNKFIFAKGKIINLDNSINLIKVKWSDDHMENHCSQFIHLLKENNHPNTEIFK